ncbi:hypothetical protein [Sporosarcina sp. UB5]|uniref:hypothetical protein n=1 Tax=Sporosarcina sp. UB5 TaxID=3047463 RepID=UPI003D7A44B6
MQKIDKFLNRSVSSYFTIAVIGVFALFAAMIIPWLIPGNIIGAALQNLAQINITVAIGLGTLVIAFKAEVKIKALWTRRILVLLMMSSLCFSLSFVNQIIIQAMYMTISGMLLVSIILSSARFILDHVDR